MMLAGIDNDSTYSLLCCAAIVIGCIGLYRLVRWFCSGPVQPEPWEKDVAEALKREEARPLCCHCLEPHSAEANFCPDCGAPVGQYTNLLPFPYLFSVGHLLRTGTRGEYKRTPFTVIGFVLLGLVEYSFFAPIYWLRLLFGSKPVASVTPSPPPLPPTNG